MFVRINKRLRVYIDVEMMDPALALNGQQKSAFNQYYFIGLLTGNFKRLFCFGKTVGITFFGLLLRTSLNELRQ